MIHYYQKLHVSKDSIKKNIYKLKRDQQSYYLFVQGLYSALFTNKRALMRCLTNRIFNLYKEM